ncbi:Molybdopterin guanine dinucleotide synthesis protein B [Candidatus Electrothrix aarhusensis]|uniref:Molybdopterin guanine dinucleotide synthesis protein B n=1 Tax=Candidatus Electrothrix aarhusensis TaxID=1859131 RepID=A0A444IVL6_9BACT|nr:Molybdopterin guanine dinucleotide synthesis protein B [Candidatus Electrothrix aarhusensis]
MKNKKKSHSLSHIQAHSLPHPLAPYPVLGICGNSGAGKTTLIEALIPRLRSTGLHVAVVKDGAHKVQIDAPGKDSDRFFSAGADVALLGEQHFIRHHQQGDLTAFLVTLCSSYDIVLIEGHATTAIPKIWLSGQKAKVMCRLKIKAKFLQS